MRNKYLLGVNNCNELVFGEYEITTRNKLKEFVASFDTVRPFNGDNVDLEDYYSDYVDNFDAETVLEWLKEYDCAPSELCKNLADDCYDVRDALDCSIYPKCYHINGSAWYFESVSGGQHDIRKDGMIVYVNKEACELLLNLWDNYHLKEVDAEVEKQIDKLTDLFEETNVDEETWITNYIEENMECFA